MDTLHIPDVIRAPKHGLSLAQIIERERMPLPSHAIQGGNFRQWAVAVCTAEVKHRERDYLRVERLLGVSVDRWDFPNNDEIGQFPHEAHAGAALLWMSHLQAHESERRTAWDCLRWRLWPAKRRADWLAKRRSLWAGFLNQVRAYQSTKSDI